MGKGFTWDDLQPGDYQPGNIDGGLPKLVRIWEYLRELNEGGYGDSVLADIKGVMQAGPRKVTSCSPFTATAIYMALDSRPVDTSQPYSLKGPYEPLWNGGKPMTGAFYRLHNSFGPYYYAYGIPESQESWDGFKGWKPEFKSEYVDHIPALKDSILPMKFINHSAGSVVAHNLGVKVDPKQMRRGDLVGIDWMNNHGHAVFCWNVHLNKKGDVDCFQLVSSNGTSKAGGAGITVFRYDMSTADYNDPAYLKKKDGKWVKSKDMFSGILADQQAYPDYIKAPYWWFGLPGVKKEDINFESFGVPKGQVQVAIAGSMSTSVQDLHVARFFGVTPPEPYLRDDGKSAGDQPAPQAPKPTPVATVKSKPVEDAPKDAPKQEEKKDPPPKAPPPDEAPAYQMEVEIYLQQLWNARWIRVDPGTPDAVNDAQSQAAIKDFQARWMNGNVPHLGHADANTRKVMGYWAAYAMGMPMVNVGLRTLVKKGKHKKLPGDNPMQLDDDTRASVKEFQRKHDLGADGIPGEHTQKKLVEVLKQEGADEPAPAQQQDAPAQTKDDAPAPAKQDDKPAIKTVYFTNNYGKAGSKTSVAMTTTALDGKTFSVKLSQGDAAAQITIASGKGSVEVAIPDGLKDGTEISATVSGEGLSAETKAKFTVGSPSTTRITSSKIKVGGKDFVDWFNKVFRPPRDGKTGIVVHGKDKQFFPDSLAVPKAFREVWDNVSVLVGPQGATLNQFAAMFCIMYNETGGYFLSQAESESAQWERQLAYCFGTEGGKASYNMKGGSGPTAKHSAGDLLKEWGVISDQADVDAWNGYAWSESDVPKEKRKAGAKYPAQFSDDIKKKSMECDYYKFRGRGLSQITWREGYYKYGDPALKDAGYPKTSVEMTNDELNAALKDPKVYLKVVYNEWHKGSVGEAFKHVDDDPPNFKNVGLHMAGGSDPDGPYPTLYNKRCLELINEMKAAGWECDGVAGDQAGSAPVQHDDAAPAPKKDDEPPLGDPDCSWCRKLQALMNDGVDTKIRAGGSDKASIQLLQYHLVQFGYDLGTGGSNGDGVDGGYGDNTSAALSDFLSEIGESGDSGKLTADGCKHVLGKHKEKFRTKGKPKPQPQPEASEMHFGVDWAYDMEKQPPYDKIKQQCTFALVRSSYAASSRADKTFIRDWPKLKEAGLVRGAYFFLSIKDGDFTPEKQAAKGIELIGDLEKTDFPPSIDVEFNLADTGMTAKKCLEWVRTAVKLFKDHYGIAPMIYTSTRVWVEAMQDLDAPDLIECPLWCAKPYLGSKGTAAKFDKSLFAGGKNAPAQYIDGLFGKNWPAATPRPWKDPDNWWFHQYMGDAKWLGVGQVDVNRFNSMVKGATGERVKWVQRRLGVAQSGTYDDATVAKIQDLQKQNNIDGDGTIGPQTFALLSWMNP